MLLTQKAELENRGQSSELTNLMPDLFILHKTSPVAPIDPFRIWLLYSRLLQTVKLNEQLTNKAEELKRESNSKKHTHE